MPVTTVLLVRHGETPFHADNRYCGRTDVSITETGVRQAEALAAWAADAALTAVYCSTMRRAVQTATPVANAAGLPLRRDGRFVELDFGDAEGLTSAQMRQRWPAERDAFEADPVANPLPGGEDPHAAMDRGERALSDVVAAHPGGVVLVVCHSTFLRLVTCRMAGVDPSGYRRRFPKVANTSGAVLRHDDPQGPGSSHAGWSLLTFNPSLHSQGFRLDNTAGRDLTKILVKNS